MHPDPPFVSSHSSLSSDHHLKPKKFRRTYSGGRSPYEGGPADDVVSASLELASRLLVLKVVGVVYHVERVDSPGSSEDSVGRVMVIVGQFSVEEDLLKS